MFVPDKNQEDPWVYVNMSPEKRPFVESYSSSDSDDERMQLVPYRALPPVQNQSKNIYAEQKNVKETVKMLGVSILAFITTGAATLYVESYETNAGLKFVLLPSFLTMGMLSFAYYMTVDSKR